MSNKNSSGQHNLSINSPNKSRLLETGQKLGRHLTRNLEFRARQHTQSAVQFLPHATKQVPPKQALRQLPHLNRDKAQV